MNQRGHYGAPLIGQDPKPSTIEELNALRVRSSYELAYDKDYFPLVMGVMALGLVASIASQTRRGAAVVEFFTKER
jgi:hypothetical protein